MTILIALLNDFALFASTSAFIPLIRVPLVMVRESVRLGPFHTEIIEGQVKPFLGDTAHIMVMPLKVGEGQLRDSRPLLLGLHVLHVYTHLKNGSSKVSLVVRNTSNTGVPVARVVSASPVPPTELSPDMEAVLGTEARPEPMPVVVRQEKLLEKLNLDRLAHWSPGNAVAVRELVLAYHDVFTLEGNELGCTSAIKHEIRIENSEPFKEWFWPIPPPFLEVLHSRICWRWGQFVQANHRGAMQWSWSGRKTVLCASVSILDASKQWTKKDLYPLPHIQEVLESMAGSAHFSSMDFKSGFWQIKMALELQQYIAFTVGNLRFYKFTRWPFGLCNAPMTFQHLMQNTLGELNLTYCVIYLDDVIVFGHTKEEHLEHLRVVFKRFWEFNLKLKSSKCSFFQSEIIYLAHHIS